MSFRFWQRWLQCVCAASALFGLLFLVAPDSVVLAGYNRRVLEAFHGAGEAPAAVAAHQSWALAVMGSVTLGWAILLLWIATVPFGRRERWAWSAIAVSVLAWAAGDSIASWRAGIVIEVLWNLGVAAAIALPLLMTWRQMAASPAERSELDAGTSRFDTASRRAG